MEFEEETPIIEVSKVIHGLFHGLDKHWGGQSICVDSLVAKKDLIVDIIILLTLIACKSWLHSHPNLKSKCMIHKILRQKWDLYHNLDPLYRLDGEIKKSTHLRDFG